MTFSVLFLLIFAFSFVNSAVIHPFRSKDVDRVQLVLDLLKKLDDSQSHVESTTTKFDHEKRKQESFFNDKDNLPHPMIDLMNRQYQNELKLKIVTTKKPTRKIKIKFLEKNYKKFN